MRSTAVMQACLACVLAAATVFTAIARADAADEAQTVEQPTPPPASSGPWYSKLPFLAEEARKRGHELPLPFGAALIFTGLKDRKIDVTDVRIGIEGSAQPVNDFLELGSTSTVFNANLKFDAWLLPFANVYALVGYVHNDSTTHARVTLTPGSPGFDTDIETELDGMVGGVGLTLAGGYQNFYLVVDANYNRADLGFDDNFTAVIASVRAGWNGKLGELPAQLWLGAGNWDTAATAKGHADLPDGSRLIFEADQEPETNWMYDIGGNFELSKRWQLVVDIGADFRGGYYAVIGPTYRFPSTP